MEGVFDFSDIAQLQGRSIRKRKDLDVCVLDASVDLALAADKDFATRGLDGPSWHIERGGANRLAHSFKRQSVLTQSEFTDFN